MKLGVIFPQSEIGNDPIVIRDFAQTVEGLGFDYLLAYDHVVGIDEKLRPDVAAKGPYRHTTPFHEPMTLFSYLAGVTTTLHFATGVIILPQRQTVLFAKQAAQVDIFSGGRLRIAVGTGWNEAEYEALGMDFKTRGRRMDEQIGFLRRLWTEDVLTFEGEFDRIRGAGLNPMPVQRPIPLWVGGIADVAMRRAARLGDGWSPVMPPELADEKVGAFRNAVVKAGRDPNKVGFEIIVMAGTTVGWPPKTAAQAADWLLAYKKAGATHGAVHTMALDLKTPADHIAYIQEYARLIGLTK